MMETAKVLAADDGKVARVRPEARWPAPPGTRSTFFRATKHVVVMTRWNRRRLFADLVEPTADECFSWRLPGLR